LPHSAERKMPCAMLYALSRVFFQYSALELIVDPIPVV